MLYEKIQNTKFQNIPILTLKLNNLSEEIYSTFSHVAAATIFIISSMGFSLLMATKPLEINSKIDIEFKQRDNVFFSFNIIIFIENYQRLDHDI